MTVRRCLIIGCTQITVTHNSSLVYHLLDIVFPKMTVPGIVKSFNVRSGL